MGLPLHDDGFREFVGGEHEEYMHVTGVAGKAVHDAGRHEQCHPRTDGDHVSSERRCSFSLEEGETLLDRVSVQEHPLTGLQPLLGHEQAA